MQKCRTESSWRSCCRLEGDAVTEREGPPRPWREVQERLKKALPDVLSDRDKIAYGLVPKAMDALFGQQDTGWKTEKRPAKRATGYTTWIVIIQAGGSA